MAEAMILGIVTTGKIPKNQIIVTNRRNKSRLQQLEDTYGITQEIEAAAGDSGSCVGTGGMKSKFRFENLSNCQLI